MSHLQGNNRPFPTIPTHRLLLRPFTVRDVDSVTNALSQPETTYWLQHVPYPYTSSDSAAWITKHPQSWHLGISLELAIEEKTTQQLAGTIGLFELTQEKNYLGYWLAPQYWGKGYCHEAALALTQWASAHLGLHTIRGRCIRENSRSARTLQRIGMTLEKVEYDSRLINGTLHDVMHYGLTLRCDGSG
ncbi:N-acetyltransferase [Salmonella enterica subsp. enterica serovar Dortmund]|nr:N-acetyltransferase [Salmonella enterica subsp. enterica serovar Dortmund]ECB1959135.1 N-acetyltransferase [Salmonella enterica subsp. enterica serovar Dortmund]HDC2122733.1 GNAT family N-acetyltransferase [Salmonella enterica]